MNNKNRYPNEINKLELNARSLLKNKKITFGLARVLRQSLKEIDLYKNHINGKAKIKYKNLSNIPRKIQIGGGKRLLDGFLNIDIVPPADIIVDIREGLPLKPDFADLIFSEHFLEHINYPISVKKFIKDCHRVLKKNGKIIIGVPDSELIIENYVKRNNDFWKLMIDKWYSKRNYLKHFNTYIDLVNYHFRDQDDHSKYNPHYWAYDFEKLESLLAKAGFVNINQWKFDKSIANPKRKFGSIYITATK